MPSTRSPRYKQPSLLRPQPNHIFTHRPIPQPQIITPTTTSAAMDKLSTELDTKIATFLDTRSLSSFSKVSKYYRSVAESILYKDIVLKDYDEYTLKRLFLTLLARKELALYILSMTVVEHGGIEQSREQKEKNNMDLWAYANAIQETIADVISAERGSQDIHTRRATWFSSIFRQQPTSVDHILTLILCMALNIRNIDLYHHDDVDIGGPDAYMHVRSVLLKHWTGDNAPFQKVKALTFHGPAAGDFITLVLPTMTSLEVRKTCPMVLYDGTLFKEPLPMPAQPLLRRLVFSETRNLSAELLCRTVQSKLLCNLKELVVDCPRIISPDLRCDLDSLIRTLGKRIPGLESLRWTNQTVHENLWNNPDPNRFPQFKSFKALTKLRKLHVDFDLLIHPVDNRLESLADPHTILPDSLEDLTIEDCKEYPLHRLIEKLHKKIECTENLSEEVSMAIAFLASKFTPLKRLALSVALQQLNYAIGGYNVPVELEPSDVVFYRFAADVLVEKGLDFEVYRKPKDFLDVPRLLVKHGFTAPLPHAREELYVELKELQSSLY